MQFYSDFLASVNGPYNEGRHREENHPVAVVERLNMTLGEMIPVVAAGLGAGVVFRPEAESKLKLQLACWHFRHCMQPCKGGPARSEDPCR